MWNLSPLIHQSTLVSPLPKHDGGRIEVHCRAAFERRSNSSFGLIIGPDRVKPERSLGQPRMQMEELAFDGGDSPHG